LSAKSRHRRGLSDNEGRCHGKKAANTLLGHRGKRAIEVFEGLCRYDAKLDAELFGGGLDCL
jgi:hypothetical protein